jgi:methylmalonyl-CoA/ethylmalonyl-CoA epimerase
MPYCPNAYLCAMAKLEHIGIAVRDLKAATALYEKILNSSCYKVEEVESEKVNTAFIRAGETKIELLQSTTEDGVIARFIEKKGEGLHHIAIEVDDIYAEMERLKKEGFQLLMDQPKRGADNKLICFLHPKSASGVLLELCQEIK